MDDLKNDTETEQEEQEEIPNESNSYRSGGTTTSSPTSDVSDHSVILIDSAEADYDSATSDGSSSLPSGFHSIAAPNQGIEFLPGDNFDPDPGSLMEEGRAGLSALQELGAAELTARALNFPDVIFESVSEWSSQSTTANGGAGAGAQQQQQQSGYLWPESVNGKFFNVDQTSLKILLAGTYQFGSLLGAGAYSWVVEGVNLHTGEAVAVKLSNGTPQANEHMDNEISVLKRIGNDSGFPSCMWSGVQETQKILIMEKLGPSLTTLLVACNGTFTLKTTLMIADQCVAKLQKLHDYGFIHSDIKPDNIVMGIGELRYNQVFLIDYGLAKGVNRSNNYAGDILYASLNVHRGGVVGPLDDLESLGYALLHLQMGKLPWSNLATARLDDNELYRKVHAMKMEVAVGSMQEYPSWFMKYMRYCVWNSSGTPDYKKIRRLFQEEMNQNQFAFDCQYDWVLFKYVYQFAFRQ